MTNVIKNNGLLFLLSSALMVSACNSSDKTEESNSTGSGSTSNPASTETAQTEKQVKVNAFTSGALDTLFVDAASFTALPKARLVSQFIFKQDGSLTLHSWHAKGILGDSFDKDPDFKFDNAGPSGYNYGPGIYFGNLVISKKEVDDIKDVIKKYNATYVLFIPQQPGTHITYDVKVSDQKPGLVKALVITDTGVDANPSPPKNY